MKLYKNSHSQSGQESMVLSVLKEMKQGFYVEIGAWDGVDLSNTFLLETEYQWKGIALDIEKKYVKRYNRKRKNKCIQANALETNYSELFKFYDFPNVIDYLQLDIEPAVNTFNCLQAIPLDSYKFKVITYEHDLYATPANSEYKEKAFEIFSKYGYRRIASDVCNQGNPFEDWYVHPEFVNLSEISQLKDNTEFSKHFIP